jgi:hypothetical protein
MTKENPNDECRKIIGATSVDQGRSGFVIPSSFVIRASSLIIALAKKTMSASFIFPIGQSSGYKHA